MLDDLPVTLGDEFRPHLVSQSPDLTLTDVDPGHLDGIGGVTERGESRGRGDDTLDHGRTVAVLIQTQWYPQGGKSPGGSRDSEPPARPAGPRLPAR